MICKKCNFDITPNNFNRHFINCDSSGPRLKRPKMRIGRGGWNKGLDKTDLRVKRISELVSKTMTGRPGIVHTDESKDKIRKAAIINKLGGHTSKFRINYKGVNLQSSYEYKVALSLDENLIKWERPTHFNWIDDLGINHRYYPDFYLIDFNIYLDPKNDYLIVKDSDKIVKVRIQNNVNIIVLNKYQLDWNSIKCFIRIIGGAPHL